ncbi:glycosyltransferase family 2 protein [Aestuariivivens sediminicola]|uniref:glycosyltransferase family 2 protein n=1 Tax=Aestuariivivens sediminicola TaxID=2913560 RepID=UPI001F56D97F|nr:glycosyltransferase family 2 protein [Aestuariivivens sediminicola]
MVSIIIPYFERPVKLRRALDAIKEQSYKAVEVIVVDDGSKEPIDDTLLKQVEYIKCKDNKGPGAARNVGLKKATGEYIVFLDSDDYWAPLFLEKIVDALKMNQQAIMAYTQGYLLDADGIITKDSSKKLVKPNNILPSVLQYRRPWFTSACVWRTSKIKRLKWLETRAWEDYAFDVNAAIICNIVICVDEFLIYYDISGEDKLSDQSAYQASIEKNKSIIHIAKCINQSNFFRDHLIKRLITKLLISNLIALLSNDIEIRELYLNSVAMIRKYRGFWISELVLFSTNIKPKFGLFLLRKLRRTI